MLSQNVLSRWLYVLYVTTAALKMMTNPVHERRNIMIMIYQHVIHAQVLTIIPRAGCYFNMWMEAKNSKEVTCSPLSCIKRESKKKEFQRWIQYYIWVGGYGYKDCSGGLLVGMPLWSRFTAYVASCCSDTKNKVLESGQNKKIGATRSQDAHIIACYLTIAAGVKQT